MNQLIQRLARAVKAVLTGFDRIVFKGMIRPLAYEEGAMNFCRGQGMLYKDYKHVSCFGDAHVGRLAKAVASARLILRARIGNSSRPLAIRSSAYRA